MSDLENTAARVNELAVEYNAATAEFMEVYGEKIKSLTAELAAATQGTDWTPITSVEQVEGLAAGFYELRDSSRDDSEWHCVSVKLEHNNWSLFYSSSNNSTGFNGTDIETCYTEYKLIRAFSQEAAPAIPKGAIENTLENREELDSGYYFFYFGHTEGIAMKFGGFWHVLNLGRISNDSIWFRGAKYFYPINESEMLAALEAPSKGEQ